MKIKTEEINIVLSNEEARDIAYAIRYSLERTIENHILVLQDTCKRGFEFNKSVFIEQDSKLLNIACNILSSSGEDVDSVNNFKEQIFNFMEQRYIEKYGSLNRFETK